MATDCALDLSELSLPYQNPSGARKINDRQVQKITYIQNKGQYKGKPTSQKNFPPQHWLRNTSNCHLYWLALD